MSEIERYNGLTPADKPALLDARKRGDQWVTFFGGRMHFDAFFPIQRGGYSMLITEALAQIAEMESKVRYDAIVSEVEKWPDWKKEAYNALATSKHAKKLVIGKRKQTPLTWNERINQMTVEEKAPLFQHNDCFIYKLTGTAYCDRHSECEECTKQFLRSPYTEGETK